MAIRRKKSEVETVARASQILERWCARESGPICETDDAAKLMQMRLAGLDREVFAVLFLDCKHRAIAFEILFYGTINYTQVPPREVARAALKHNAAAVIVAHNHPSGDPTPGYADKQLTDRLTQALALLDINMLDHLVVAGTGYESARWGLSNQNTNRRRRQRARRARTARKAA